MKRAASFVKEPDVRAFMEIHRLQWVLLTASISLAAVYLYMVHAGEYDASAVAGPIGIAAFLLLIASVLWPRLLTVLRTIGRLALGGIEYLDSRLVLKLMISFALVIFLPSALLALAYRNIEDAPRFLVDQTQGTLRSVTFLLSMVLAYFIARGFTRRICALKDAASAIADGDLSRRIPVSGCDELSPFGIEFNRMVDRTQSLVEDLRAERAELRTSLEDLQLARAAQQRFVANVSHDLRTPLASMQVYVEALQDGLVDTPEKQSRALGTVHDSLLYLGRLVEDLLDLSRLETDLRDALNRRQTDMGDLARRAAERFQAVAGERNQRLNTIVFDGDLTVSADPDRMTQVLNNLVDNAVRYTPAGGSVTIAAGRAGEGVEVRVRDTGPGIANDDQDRVFDRFYRADPARQSATGGLGLGLAIAREVAEAHSGRLTFRNADGGGAEFSLWLPVAVPSVQASSTEAPAAFDR